MTGSNIIISYACACTIHVPVWPTPHHHNTNNFVLRHLATSNTMNSGIALSVLILALTLPIATISLRTAATAFVYGCPAGYFVCLDKVYCCQLGSTCFRDSVCRRMVEMRCRERENMCGTGSLAGCCPVGSVCVDSAEGRCTLSSGGVRGIGNVGFVKVAVAGAMGYFAV